MQLTETDMLEARLAAGYTSAKPSFAKYETPLVCDAFMAGVLWLAKYEENA